jgi:uncharacterized protein
MSDRVFESMIRRVSAHCERSAQPVVRLMFHGGEPMLAGASRFRRWLVRIAEELSEGRYVSLAIQTNATLIDDDWARLFAEFRVEVGVSLDGPPEVNDRFRVDHGGRGSYERVMRGVEALRRHQVPFSVLSVIQPGTDGLATYRHFCSMAPRTINFLFPDHNHEDIEGVRRAHGPNPIADFLLPVVDEWYGGGSSRGDVPLLRNMCRIILGGESRSDMFGNSPLGFVFIEPDGEIEGLDVLRIDAEGLAATGLNVTRDDFLAIASAHPFHAAAIFYGLPVPRDCGACPERETCAGGYLPHRYSRSRGFDNRSVWCPDILVLFGHLRRLLAVDVPETALRRRLLSDLALGRR